MSEVFTRSLTPSGVGMRIWSTSNIGLVIVVVVLFYTCLWAMLAGAVLGGLLALFAANSEKLKTYLLTLIKQYASNRQNDQDEGLNESGCKACGDPECRRHQPHISLEPWTGLRVHKQLDQAIEDFYNGILESFVSEWYSKISPQPFFLEELRRQLRYASAALLRRACEINLSKLLVDKLVPCALHHHSVWVTAQRQRQFYQELVKSGRENGVNGTDGLLKERRYSLELGSIEQAAVDGPLRRSLHPAVRNRDEELRYLRSVTTNVMRYLLPREERDNKIFQVLIREIFAGWVLLSLTDVLADPYIINTLIVLATDDKTIPRLPANPNYKVEFLESFSRSCETYSKRRSALLNVSVDAALTSRNCLYALMAHMKTCCTLHVLQFACDIKPFQMRILNPELTKNEEIAIFNEAWDLYVQYFDPHSPSAIPFPQHIVEEMRTVLGEGPANVKNLQTTKALYQSSKFVYSLLENVYIPKFLHSEEFYKMFLGPRIQPGYNNHMKKRSQESLFSSSIRLSNKMRNSRGYDGQILDCFGSLDGAAASDDLSILSYLDSLAEHAKTEGRDVSRWTVQFVNVEHREEENKRGIPPTVSRVFTMCVRSPPPSVDSCTSTGDARADGPQEDGGRTNIRTEEWAVQRSEHDLHLLRAKLMEFHGETLLQDLALPSRRDNSPLETLRYKYEDFVQRLLRIGLLASSQLLHIFLTARGDFAVAVQRASLANNADLTNIYQSVAHKLRKEKGRYLDGYIKSLLMCSDLDRYRNIKQNVEEAEEVNESTSQRANNRTRDIRTRPFDDNFHLSRQPVHRLPAVYQDKLTGFTQCFLYLLRKVLKARGVVSSAIALLLQCLRDLVDSTFCTVMEGVLGRVVSQQRLGYLIRLGHEILLIEKSSERNHTESEQYERARQRARSSAVLLALGADLSAVDDLLSMLQSPALNKQLVYNLLDLCLAELFPELLEKEETVKIR